ncbi:hypothetical protein M5K25_011414 [Dendrobium thyrsiflorum]|uniref:Uncharacterized protein n=1 Tax=Dendrobium thyrsiflorum TaxID=117978 RepID=A0ABD0V9R7_DENTH
MSTSMASSPKSSSYSRNFMHLLITKEMNLHSTLAKHYGLLIMEIFLKVEHEHDIFDTEAKTISPSIEIHLRSSLKLYISFPSLLFFGGFNISVRGRGSARVDRVVVGVPARYERKVAAAPFPYNVISIFSISLCRSFRVNNAWAVSLISNFVGTTTRSSQNVNQLKPVEEQASQPVGDDFMGANELSFEDNVYTIDQQGYLDINEDANDQPSETLMSRSKRSSYDVSRPNQRIKKRANIEKLTKFVAHHNENTEKFLSKYEKMCPVTIDECLDKLGSIEKNSTEVILVVHDVLMENPENKSTLMRWNGDLLQGWIEGVRSRHPHYYAASAWLP